MQSGKHLTGLVLLATAVFAAGCGGMGGAGTEEATEIPVVSSGSDGKVVAEAIIQPARWGELRFDLSGDVVTVLVEEGDVVSAGDPLAQLDTEDLARAMASAEISLEQAQLRLETLEEPPDDDEITAARTAVSDAASAYEEARANLALTESGESTGEAVRAARQAKEELYRAYEEIADILGSTSRRTGLVYNAYLDAEGRYNRAVENARLQMVAAQNQVARAAQALGEAQRSLERLLEGTDDLDLEAAQLDVKAAQVALQRAQDDLAEATLEAPFDGTVARVEVEEGDVVTPGQVGVVLATLGDLQAVTTDLTELDVAQVAAGQAAEVTVDALPNEAFGGVVSEVALQPGDYRGDVVYAVTVELADLGDAPLRWGMTALVEIEAE